MPLFRKRPIIVKAEQWHEFNKHARDIGVCECHKDFCKTADPTYLDKDRHVHTLEGTIPTQPGDWIVTGIMNEKWPVKDCIFKKTYERITKRTNK